MAACDSKLSGAIRVESRSCGWEFQPNAASTNRCIALIAFLLASRRRQASCFFDFMSGLLCFGLGERLCLEPMRTKHLQLPAPTLGHFFAPLRNSPASDFEQLGQGFGGAGELDCVLGLHSEPEFSTLNTMSASQLNSLAGLISTMTLADRIREAIGDRSPSDVAAAVKLSRGAVSLWLSGGIKSLKAETASKLEALTGYNATWIATGKGDKMSNQSNVQPVTTRNRVPLISWVAAGNLEEVQDMYQPGEADDWPDTQLKMGKNSFALLVDGDSMTNPIPGDVTFPNGTVILVDPSKSCDAGDFVVAKDVSTQKATFKKLVLDGGRWYLKPLNPAYPTVEIDDPAVRMIGKVVEMQLRRTLP